MAFGVNLNPAPKRRWFGRSSAAQQTTRSVPDAPHQPDRSKADVDGVAVWLDANIARTRAQLANIHQQIDEKTPNVHEFAFVCITGLVVLLLAGIVWFTPAYVPSALFGLLNPQYFLYLLVGVYILAGFFMVETEKIMGLEFAGMPMIVFGNGLKWAPWLIFKKSTEFGTFAQAEFPGDRNSIQWDDEKSELRPGMMRPNYVLFAENPKGILPTDRQMNVGVAFLAKVRIIKSRFFDLILNVSPIDSAKREQFMKSNTGGTQVSDRILEVFRHLSDTGAATSLELAGQISYNEATTHLAQVNELLLLRFKLAMAEWGIDVVEGSFTKIDAGHTFNSSMQKRGDAVAKRDAIRFEAEGEREALILKGEGAAIAELARLNAIAEGTENITKKTGVDGAGVLAAQVATELAKGPNNTIVVDGAAGLMGIALAGAQAIKGTTKAGTPTT